MGAMLLRLMRKASRPWGALQICNIARVPLVKEVRPRRRSVTTATLLTVSSQTGTPASSRPVQAELGLPPLPCADFPARRPVQAG